MANEFKKISSTEETRYVLESGDSGGTSAGSIASVEMPMGVTQKRAGQVVTQEAGKPNPVAKAAKKVAKGAGRHKNPKDALTQPRKEKHKKDSYSESLEQALASKVAEGGYDYNQPDPAWVTINGKRWKWFFNYVSARKAMDTLNAKFRAQGSKNKADWEPADLEDNPEHGIKVGESALDKFRQGSAERQAKHDKIEAERKANAAAGKEPDVKSAVDRLDAQINAKEEIDHEGDTVKNSLHTIIRVATHLEKNISDEEQFPEWVSEKVGAIHSMMVTVMNYVISDHEQKDGDRLDQGPKKEDHSTATGGWGQGSMNAAYKSSALAGAGHDDRTMESDDYFNKLKETLEAAVDERSKSQAQWNLMHAVAHNPAFAKKVGVKQSVGKEFSAADAGHNPKSLPKRVVPKKKK